MIYIHSTVTEVNGPETENVIGFLKRVNGIKNWSGQFWEYNLFIVMHAMTELHGSTLPAFDVSEIKPKSLPDEFWRMWIRLRITK